MFYLYNLSLFNSSDVVCCCSFWLIFCPLDPHIFVDPDPGNHNLADPTDLDPKHCSQELYWKDKDVTHEKTFSDFEILTNFVFNIKMICTNQNCYEIFTYIFITNDTVTCPIEYSELYYFTHKTKTTFLWKYRLFIEQLAGGPGVARGKFFKKISNFFSLHHSATHKCPQKNFSPLFQPFGRL